jgi:hypothetical protein
MIRVCGLLELLSMFGTAIPYCLDLEFNKKTHLIELGVSIKLNIGDNL